MEDVLKAENISYSYTNTCFIEDLSVSFKKGEMVSIIGPNGSGKSTMLKTISRLLKPQKGVIYLEGANIKNMNDKEIAKKMTMLPQVNEHRLELTVRDLVKKGRTPYLKWFEEYSNKHEKYVDWALEVTSLTHLQYRPLHALSGGERQRAWIAMSIAQTPNTLLLDEPTSYLDIAHQLEVMELLTELNKTLGITIIMVLHDLNQAAKYSDRIIAMKNGKVVKQGTPLEVYSCDFFREVFSIEANVYHDGSIPIFSPCGLVSKNIKKAEWSVV